MKHERGQDVPNLFPDRKVAEVLRYAYAVLGDDA